MTPQQIKDNAPEGATHYNRHTDTYYMIKDAVWYHWHFTEWRESFYKNGLHQVYLKPL